MKSNKKALKHEPKTCHENKQMKTSKHKTSKRVDAHTERTTIPVISQPSLTAFLMNQSDCVIFVFKVFEFTSTSSLRRPLAGGVHF